MKKRCLLLLVITVLVFGASRTNAQQLRGIVRQVDASVVVIKTV